MIAGRGGAYVGLLDATGIGWWPAVRGLMATVNMIAVADPRLPGRVYVGNMDWTFIASADNGATFLGNAVPAGAPTTGDVVALDQDVPAGSPSTVYLAASRRGQNTGLGIVYSNPDPVANPTGWTNEGLPVSNDVVALGVGHAADGTRVILASVTGRGLYRKDGGTWTRVTGTAPFGSGGYGSFAWVPGSPLVYAMDGGGIWRSTAAGAPGSWVRLTGGTAQYGNATSLVLDPVRPGVLYASDDALGGVVRISAADTAPVRTTGAGPGRPRPDRGDAGGDAPGARPRRGATARVATTRAPPHPAFVEVGNALHRDTQREHPQPVGRRRRLRLHRVEQRRGDRGRPAAIRRPRTSPRPRAPSGLASPAQTATSVSLTWDAATDDVGRHRLPGAARRRRRRHDRRRDLLDRHRGGSRRGPTPTGCRPSTPPATSASPAIHWSS